MDPKPTTIREIARQLNISVSTASKALHNDPNIGLYTRMQVKKLAAELNYQPGQTASGVRKNKTHTIGVIVPDSGEEFFSLAIAGIEQTASAKNYVVLIAQSHEDEDREKKMVETMAKHHVNGLLVSISKNTSTIAHFDDLKKHKIPVVFFDRVPESPHVYKVSCSLKKNSEQMVDWLVKRSLTRIAFVKGPQNMGASDDRLQGYIQGLAKNNLRMEKDLLLETDLTPFQNTEAIKKLLALKKPPAAIIAFNDRVAIDMIEYSKTRGYKINQDIYFAGYANLSIPHGVNSAPIISVEQFPRKQAELATTMLMDLISARDTTVPAKSEIAFEGKLVVRSGKVIPPG